MGLVVSVTACNGVAPRHPLSIRVEDQVCILGRQPDCQLELPDAECSVSGRHALVAPAGGGYTITDISTNGTFLNDAAAPVPANQPVALQDGDQICIGPYLLQVSLERDRGPVVSDPFAAAPNPSSPEDPLPGLPDRAASPDIMELLDPGVGSAAVGDSPLGKGDGFGEFGQPAVLSSESSLGAVFTTGQESPRPSIEHMHLGVPSTGPSASLSSSGPESENVPPAATVPADSESTAAPVGIPDDYDVLNDAFASADSGGSQDDDSLPLGAESPAAQSAPELDVPEPPLSDRGNQIADASEFDEATALSVAVDVSVPASQGNLDFRQKPEASSMARSPVADLSDEINAFLSGLGVGDAATVRDPDALLRTSGQLLRAMTEGMMAVMMARASFKSELRLEVTTIRSRENNPFQFCVDPDDALDRLLWRRSRGFLDPTLAVSKTFEDIQAHQMAMIAGLRAALKALLARFEPTTLEKHFEGQSHLDKLLPMARKSRCWDLFVSTFDQVAEDASDDFMRLFSDAFNRAYEEQVRRLAEEKRSDSA
ncbi:MAG: type VI secretion system-associated FHA domain protein TagH [Thiohalocapsa sp.]